MSSKRKCWGRKGGKDGSTGSTIKAGALGSNSSSRRCELCGCAVPGNDQAWQTHTTGIRHRRNLASQRVFGEAGHAVASVFEHTDSAPPPTYRGKDLVLLAAQQAAGTAAATGSRTSRPAAAAAAHSSGPGSTAGGLHQQLQRLQQQLRKHLASQVGVGVTYTRAVEQFSSQALVAAHQQLQSVITEQRQQQQQQVQQEQQQVHQGGQQPGHNTQLPQCMPLEQQQQHQQQHWQSEQAQQQSWRLAELRLSLHEPAQIACLAVVLPEDVASLHLTVPHQSYGPLAAATSAAVACFASSLATHHLLKQLALCFQCEGYRRIVQQGGGSLAQLPLLWGNTLAALTAAMQVNCGLLRLVLAAYPGQLPPDELAALQTVLATARPRLRLAVLSATHARLGAGSPLAQLPHEVLAGLVDRAVPRQACSLELGLPQGLAGDCSSSSSDDDSSDDDSSSEEEDAE